uniref:Glycosyl transferase CAP10 domain-containing protein n=1 Tax=viral metagenome TaxID=1070528 RepID=A0A6C0B0J7_9ZZZZ
MKTFNWEQYIQNYPDLSGFTREKAIRHYNRFGKKENRTDSVLPDFNNGIISGEKIQLRCDYFIGTLYDINSNPLIKLEVHKFPEKWLKFSSDVKKECKIFCYTHRMFEFMDLLHGIEFPFDIYFHNSDENFTEEMYQTLKKVPFVKQIYSQNNTVKEVITLPIGQANSSWKHGNSKILGDKMKCIEKSMDCVEKTMGIFLNFNITTPKRVGLRDILNFIPWVENKEYQEYIDTLAKYRFCICVEGNGLDTHRFWECVYLKVIPICVKNKWTEIMKDKVHMILLDKWEDLKDYPLNYTWREYQCIDI